MHDDARPISGRQSRLNWLVVELSRRSREPGIVAVTEKELIGWYLRYGFRLGFSREELQSSLSISAGHLDLARRLTDEDIADGKPPPEFVLWQSVEVVVNAKNIAYHAGVIRDIVWHSKDERWHFFIDENGKHLSKRYEAHDLRALRAMSTPR